MRTPSISSIAYVPEIPPDDPKRLQVYLRDEFFKIKIAIDALATGHFDLQTEIPAKPRRGNVRYFDGVNAQPNGTGGEGIWYFNGTAWVQMA